jgi:hypothetical protein
MNKLISKKAYGEYFELVMSGQKTFDLRAADFEVEPGDILELVEIDQQKNLTGRALRRKVGVVSHTKQLERWYDSQIVADRGYVIMSLLEEDK